MAGNTDAPKDKQIRSFSELLTFHCICCGREFKPVRKIQKYCSDPCRNKFGYKTQAGKLTATICLRCGRQFAPTRKWQKFCSAKCKDDLNNFFNYILEYYGL